MDRSSTKHGARLDDEMKHEVEGQMRAGRPTRAEEWHDPEPVETEDSPEPLDEIRARAEAERGRTEDGSVRRGDARETDQQIPAGTRRVTVRDVMTPVPVALDPQSPIAQVARVMRDADIGMVLVAHEERVLGLITDRDLVIRGLAVDQDPRFTYAGSLCSADLVTVGPEDDVQTASELMRANAVRRLPVVEDGEAVGVVSLGDLATQLDPRSALATISTAPSTR